MNITAALLPHDWYLPTHLVVLAALAWLVRTTSLREALRVAGSHTWLGSCVALLVLWSIRPHLTGNLDFHLLGATAVTLMFGPRMAMACLAVAVSGLVATGRVEPAALSANLLLLAVLPVALSHAVLKLSARLLPSNIFVYIFVAAFFGAAVAMVSSGVATVGLHALFGAPADAMIAAELLPYCLLLSFAEATLTGMVITLMVVYRPAWVGTFDDSRYLRPM